MFHTISQPMRDRMNDLEAKDSQDRIDGTPRLQRLRQITHDTGKFIALLAATVPPGHIIEIGTSAGYSTMWLTLAGRETGRTVTTFELLEEKVKLAQETFQRAEVEPLVELIVGDARDYLPTYKDIAFCFLDAEKDVYHACYEAVVPNLVKGGLLVADNAINHQEVLKPMLNRALEDDRVDALIVPIGNGQLMCRKR
ncbi:MAG: O-methyltransferase [Anaerolineae bacterium]|nr:O-methyltransferase [Anaerolineae bacterium]